MARDAGQIDVFEGMNRPACSRNPTIFLWITLLQAREKILDVFVVYADKVCAHKEGGWFRIFGAANKKLSRG